MLKGTGLIVTHVELTSRHPELTNSGLGSSCDQVTLPEDLMIFQARKRDWRSARLPLPRHQEGNEGD